MKTDNEKEFSISILIVESDVYFQRYMARAVNKFGYNFTIIDDGKAAMRLLQVEDFSIAIINVATPGYNGLELLKHLKQSSPGIDVIVSTTYQDDVTLTDVINTGAVDYLSKPYTIDEVRAKLARVVRERKLIHELVVENRKRLATEDELRRSHETLEKRVIERTRELEKSKVKAEAATAAQTEFIANMSHELRTPMHGILGYARLGVNKHNMISKDRLLGYFEEILNSGNRLLILLNNLLDLSKMEADKLNYRKTDNCVVTTIRKAISSFLAMAEERQISLLLQHDKPTIQACYDVERITQVIQNLLTNAIRFSEHHSEIVVKVYAKNDHSKIDDNQKLLVTVEDQGLGIPTDELQFVFDKFKQSRRTKDGAGGTGLGLSICKQIINDHDGEIWAENREVEGTTFCFTLPES